MPFPRSGSIRRWSDGDYTVTTDPSRVDLDLVHGFISVESYWAFGRTREEQARVNELSTCFSVIHEPTDAQIGFRPLIRVERWMERWNRAPNPDRAPMVAHPIGTLVV
jgi:hypothetical protein